MKANWFCLFGVLLTFLQPVSAEFAHIVIDGDFGDWGAIPSITNDPLDHVAGGVDFKEMWVANDCNYLYVRYTFHALIDPFTWLTRTYIDGDNNPSTGHHQVPYSNFGSEIMVMNKLAYQQASGTWSGEGTSTNASILFSPAAGSVTQLEFRISRAVTGSKVPYAGVPLMSSNTIRILAQDFRSPNYDHMPDTYGAAYTFALPPSHFKNVTIDGDFSDWDGIPSVATQSSQSWEGYPNWKELWIANDAKYLYVKYTLYEPFNGSLLTSFFFDGDNNKGTGFGVGGGTFFGSEIRLYGDEAGTRGVQQAGGDWHEGTLGDANILYAPLNTVAKEFEFRIARAVTGVAKSFVGQPLLTSDTIRILPYYLGKWIPEGATYAFAQAPQGTCVLIR